MQQKDGGTMTVMITGGAGFIGSNFVHTWLGQGRETLINLDKLTYAGNRANLAAWDADPRHMFVQGGIEDYDLVLSLLRLHRPRAIIHCAAESHVDRSIHGPEDFMMTNIMGTFRLLEAVRAYRSIVSVEEWERFRFIHVSTDEVFGSLNGDDPAFCETTPYAPNSPYSASKAASDHIARAYYHTYGVPVMTTNCSNNYGPYQHTEKLIPLCISRALSGEPLPIYGDGQNIRDWLYVTDHVQALMRVLEAGKVGETYSIGGNNERTNIDLVHDLCRILDQQCPRADGQSYRTQITFVTDRLGHDRRYAINSDKLKRDLGWTPIETATSGLEKTVAWYVRCLQNMETRA